MREFKQSPLPFQGQKRNFLKGFRHALVNYPSNGIYIDLFGGSGLLSHTVKSVYPEAKVVYNDFDCFCDRLRQIPETNKLLGELREVLKDYERGVKIAGIHRNRVIAILNEAAKNGYSDWITLSSSLKFAMNYSTSLSGIVNDTMYNKIRISSYDATDYLCGVDIVRMDYKQLFDQYRAFKDVVFLVDPPYLSTDTATYSSNSYWKLKDYLDVLHVLNDQNYFYFTSNKSQIVELCEWISSVSVAANPFANATLKTVNTSTTHNAGYTDIMYYFLKK